VGAPVRRHPLDAGHLEAAESAPEDRWHTRLARHPPHRSGGCRADPAARRRSRTHPILRVRSRKA